MAKTKQQLIVENNTQFPNNNTGFISPDKLRTFNVDMIDSMVDELSYGVYTASIALESASFDARIDALEGLSSSLSGSVGAISASVAALSASVLQLNDYTSSADDRLDALEIFTGSLNGFTASVEAQFAIYDEEIYNLNVHSQSLNAFTASVNSKFNTLSTTTASLQTQINTLASATSSYAISASVAAVDAAQQSQINALIAFTGSAATTGSLFVSASFTNDTITFTKGDGTTQTLGGFANTGSNVFVGNQIISGNLDISGTLTASLEEGYLYVGDASGRMLAVATSSIITQVNTGSLVNTASFNDFSSSVNTKFTAVQASTASLNAFTSSAASRLNSLEARTGSYATTGSNNFIGNQFISGGLSVTGSSPISLLSGSLSGSVISNITDTFAPVPSALYIVTLDSASYASVVTSSLTDQNTLYFVTDDFGYLLTSIFTSYSSSADTKFSNIQASTASLNTFTSSAAGRLTNLESTTASLNTSVSNLNTFTSSQNSFNASATASISQLLSFSSSLDSGYVTEAELAAATGALENTIATKLDTASFNSYTSSTDGRLTNLEATTASLNTSVSALNTFTQSQTNLNGTFATTGSNTFFGAETISGSVDISGSFKINSLNYPTASGVADYFLQTNGTNQADWNYVRTMYEEVKNGGLTTLPKGTPVFASSSVGNLSIVVAADAGDPTRMPATYVLNEELAPDAEGLGIIIGFINEVDTSAFNEGDVIYVGVGGGYTNVQPTGSALIQPLGIVNRVDATNGSGIVLNPGVSNGLPNIAEGNAWVGNVDGVPTAVATSSFGGGGSTDISALNSFTASQEALNTTFATTGSNTFEGEQTINGTFTASLEEGYAWVGDSTGTTVAVATSSFGGGGSTDISALNSFTASQEVLNTTFATTGSNTFDGDQTISGSIAFGVENFYVSGANSGSFISNITDTYTSSTPIKYVTTLDSASYAALATGSTFSPDTLYVVSGALSIPNVTEGNIVVTGSITITGSAYGNVNTLTVTSATASMDMRAANFFVLTLPTGSTTHLDATNVGLGQTVSLLVKQATTATGSLVFSPEFKFPTGSRYAATPTGSAQDIITFVTFNSTSEVFATSVKQLV
jgi:hypothetical protein